MKEIEVSSFLKFGFYMTILIIAVFLLAWAVVEFGKLQMRREREYAQLWDRIDGAIHTWIVDKVSYDLIKQEM